MGGLANTEVPQLNSLVIGATHYDVVVEGEASDPICVVPQGDQAAAGVSVPHLQQQNRCVDCGGGCVCKDVCVCIYSSTKASCFSIHLINLVNYHLTFNLHE